LPPDRRGAKVNLIMTKLLAAVLIVGVPFILSVSWFAFWVVRIVKAGRKNRQNAAPSPTQSSSKRRSPEI
jgi:hypothetical protein